MELAKSAGYANVSACTGLADSALKISERSKWNKGEILSLKTLGRCYFNNQGDGQKALAYFRHAINLCHTAHDTADLADTYYALANLFDNLNALDSALDYYNRSLLLTKEPRYQTALLGNSGNVYNNLGDYTHALANYEQALKITAKLLTRGDRTTGDSLTWVGLMLTIGDIYVSMTQYNNALSNYRFALQVTKVLKNKDLEIWLYNRIGKVNRLTGNYNEAIANYEKGLDAINSLGRPKYRYKAIVLDEISNLYLERGAPDKALKYAEESIEIVRDCNDLQQLPVTYTTLGKVHTSLGHYAPAIDYLTKAIGISEKTGALNDQKNAWEALSRVYEKMGKPGVAFDAYRHYILLRDSVYNIDKAKELVRIDLQAGYDRERLADSLKESDARNVIRLQLQRQRFFTYGGFAGFLMVLLLSFFIYRNYSQQKKANKVISKANISIQREKQISETLLLNILPEEVAQQLKSSGKVHARLYENVTVLFTDFVNFTEAGERLTPQELVAELDDCFQEFDRIADKYKVEKIKTIGDAYLAVSGLPYANPDHAADVVRVAIEIRDFMAKRKSELGDRTFDIRLGINSGSVVAGIVGLKKFAYDIWGDTVNTAARMEQNSEPGKVNISEATFTLLKGQFHCEYRGKIVAKNKGSVDMYFVS